VTHAAERKPFRAIPALFVIALILAACGGGAAPASDGAPSEPPASVPESSAPTSAPTATPGDSRVVTLHGTFIGHHSDALATADLTVEVEVVWNAGPQDIHDPNAFVLTSGSFEFSESIGGVCGGSRDEDGPLTSFVNDQSLIAADPQDRDNTQVAIIDRRMQTGGVEFSIHASYEVPNSEDCADLDRSGVGSCSLVFLQTSSDALQSEATCSGPAGDWTGTLQP
jgi:hypothetical protein